MNVDCRLKPLGSAMISAAVLAFFFFTAGPAFGETIDYPGASLDDPLIYFPGANAADNFTPQVGALFPQSGSLNNRVTFGGGNIYVANPGGGRTGPGGDVYGGIGDTAPASGNVVTVSGGQVYSVFGGLGAGFGATLNTVTIGEATVRGAVYGGRIISGSSLNAQQNTAYINPGAIIYGNVYGAYTVASGSYLTMNRVIISGGEIRGDIISGAYDFLSGFTVQGNSVNISGGTVNNANIYGGRGQSSAANPSTISNNTVTITGGIVNNAYTGRGVYGGQDITGNSAVVQNNIVNISGGTVNADIYGGYNSGNGPTSGNTVTLSGGEITGNNIYGGYGRTGSATGNTVTIGGTANLSAGFNLYGGFAGTSGDAFTGNTLNKNSAAAVSTAQNFESVNFGYSGAANIGILQTTPTGSARPGVTVNTGANTVTFDGVITGSGNLTKTGTGTLTLASENDFRGGTIIEGGTISIANEGALNWATEPSSKAGLVAFRGSGDKTVKLDAHIPASLCPYPCFKLANSFRTESGAGANNRVDLRASTPVPVEVYNINTAEPGAAFNVAAGTTLNVDLTTSAFTNNRAAGVLNDMNVEGTLNLKVHAIGDEPSLTYFASGISGGGNLNISGSGAAVFVSGFSPDDNSKNYKMGSTSVKGSKNNQAILLLERYGGQRLEFTTGKLEITGDGHPASAILMGDGLIKAGTINVTGGGALAPTNLGNTGTLTLEADTINLSNFGLLYMAYGPQGGLGDGGNGIPASNNDLLNLISDDVTINNGTVYFRTITDSPIFKANGDYLILRSSSDLNGINPENLNSQITVNVDGFDLTRDFGNTVRGGSYQFKLGDEPNLSGGYTASSDNNNIWFVVGEALPDPGPSDPGPSDPGPSDPGPSDPGPSDPGPSDPGPSDPGPSDPGPSDPGPSDPGPSDPGPSDPGPGKPGESGNTYNSLSMAWKGREEGLKDAPRSGTWASGPLFHSLQSEPNEDHEHRFLTGDKVYIYGDVQGLEVSLPSRDADLLSRGAGYDIIVSGLVVGQDMTDEKTIHNRHYTITGEGGITANLNSAFGKYVDGSLIPTGKLQKYGGGALTFKNTGGNWFREGIELYGGTVEFTQGNQLVSGDYADGTRHFIDAGITFKEGDPTLFALNDAHNNGAVNLNTGLIIESDTGRLAAGSGVVLTYTGLLSGPGNVDFSGPGTVRFDSNSSSYGRNGQKVTVSKGTLSGTGILGSASTTIMSGATLKPGDLERPLTVIGDLTFAAGSNLAVEVQYGSNMAQANAQANGGAVALAAASISEVQYITGNSMVKVENGTVAIDPTARLNVEAKLYNPRSPINSGERITVIDASSGRANNSEARFTLNTSILPRGFSVEQGWDEATARLYQLWFDYDPSLGYAFIPSSSHNQNEIGKNLDWFVVNRDPGLKEIIDRLSDGWDDAQVLKMKDQLHGDLAANALFMAFKEPWRHPFNRLDSGSLHQDDGPRFWVDLTGRHESFKDDGNAHGFTINRPGFALGLDYPLLSNGVLGANFQYTRPRLSQETGSVRADDYELGLYGLVRFEPGFDLKAYLGYSHQNYDLRRTVSLPASPHFPAAFYEELKGDARGDAFSASLELTRAIEWRENIRLIPLAALDYEKASMRGFEESDGQASLIYDRASLERLMFRVGLGSEFTFQNGFYLKPKAQVGLRLNDQKQPAVDVKFAKATLPGQPAADIWGARTGGGYLGLGLGGGLNLGGDKSFYVNYEAKIYNRATIQSGEAGFMIRW